MTCASCWRRLDVVKVGGELLVRHSVSKDSRVFETKGRMKGIPADLDRCFSYHWCRW